MDNNKVIGFRTREDKSVKLIKYFCVIHLIKGRTHDRFALMIESKFPIFCSETLPPILKYDLDVMDIQNV